MFGLTALLPALKSLGGSLFKGKGLDPTTMLLGGMSLFGGGDEGTKISSFRDPGKVYDPKQALENAIMANYRMGESLQRKGPANLRSSVVQSGPAPVNIPSLGLQIGGGLGMDPALQDASMLLSKGVGASTTLDPFQGGMIPPQRNPNGPKTAQLRNPKNG